ncbi:copper chaperone PCu(A)C [Pseudosulfitobacter sp. SM2401]|uniref:copper chaperone PCu(A)C n=1 Tax=Pseudosulfitobacter sp. SM2401 TaxID=3350098 RepID=UPI0036F3BA43
MSFKTTFTAAMAGTIMLATSAFADGIMAKDPYARAASPAAKAGAAFMMIENHTDTDDRLIGVRSDAAKRVELHTHIDKGEGVMQMTQIEGGIVIPAGGAHMMQRGGDHVMLMGLNGPLVQGETVEVTLIFENAGDVVIEIPVDNERKGTHGSMDHKSD